MERYSLHQYSLRTNWHISTEHSVIWRGDRCDGVTTDLKALHPSIPDRRIERNRSIQCYRCFTYAPLFHIPHTHFISVPMFWLSHVYAVPSVVLPLSRHLFDIFEPCVKLKLKHQPADNFISIHRPHSFENESDFCLFSKNSFVFEFFLQKKKLKLDLLNILHIFSN